ncbi:uncharacterized protein LOC103506158 [Diaphorina citri]|uniref:Uncharacterized protein LOC103506158 n=1 Tax=Diaphorina citri TaxID=121845 RepID=A0A3Q0ILF4_DIACI|nr:uncharacterized protein LOC103506158 [Diaphorina citri]
MDIEEASASTTTQIVVRVLETQDEMYGSHGEPAGPKTFLCPKCERFRTQDATAMKSHLYAENDYHRWLCNHCAFRCLLHKDMIKHHSTLHAQFDVPQSFTKLPENSLLQGWVERVVETQRSKMLSKAAAPITPSVPSSATGRRVSSSDETDSSVKHLERRGRPSKAAGSGKEEVLPKGAVKKRHKRKLQEIQNSTTPAPEDRCPPLVPKSSSSVVRPSSSSVVRPSSSVAKPCEVIDLDDSDTEPDVVSVPTLTPAPLPSPVSSTPSTPGGGSGGKKIKMAILRGEVTPTKSPPGPALGAGKVRQGLFTSPREEENRLAMNVSDKPESLYSQDRNPFDPSLQSHGANKRPFASLGPNKPAPPTAKRTKLGKPGALSELAQKNEAVKGTLKSYITCRECGQNYRTVMGLKMHIRHIHYLETQRKCPGQRVERVVETQRSKMLSKAAAPITPSVPSNMYGSLSNASPGDSGSGITRSQDRSFEWTMSDTDTPSGGGVDNSPTTPYGPIAHYARYHNDKPFSLTYSQYNHFTLDPTGRFTVKCTYCAFRSRGTQGVIQHWSRWHMLAVCYKNNKCTLYNTGVPLSYSPRMEGYDSTPVLECKSCERYGTEQYLKLYNCFCQDRICVNQTTRWNCLICKDPEKKFNSIISVFNHWCNKHKHSHDEHGMLFQCTLCQPSKRTGFPLQDDIVLFDDPNEAIKLNDPNEATKPDGTDGDIEATKPDGASNIIELDTRGVLFDDPNEATKPDGTSNTIELHTRGVVSRGEQSTKPDGDVEATKPDQTDEFPFRRRRLEHQLTKGGGTVFPSLNLVPHEKLENTLLITDRPGTTCNFILALAMRVPVLHYYYVIQCCVTKTHIKKHRLPEMSSGYSLEEKCLLDRNLTSANILGEYLIVIAMSAKTQTVIFWEKVLKFAGASVKRWKPNFDWDTLTTVCSSMQVAILIDDPEDTPDEVLAQSYDRILPTWIIQSLIHAQARDFNAHPAYRKKYPAGTHPGMNVSETY